MNLGKEFEDLTQLPSAHSVGKCRSGFWFIVAAAGPTYSASTIDILHTSKLQASRFGLASDGLMDSSPRNPYAENRLPYDVLAHIFSLCLPESPLAEPQPNINAAPMSLCHVCSSWRATALATPVLWLYIFHCLPLRWENRQPIAWNVDVFRRDMEFLKWWRQNQGSKAPFIRFEPYEQEEEISHEEVPLTADDMNFFVEYLSSAQYLDVGRFATHLFSKETSQSGSLVLCSRLHSLVTNHPNDDEDNPEETKAALVPFHIAPTLRRLCIHHVEIPPDFNNAFSNWSGLTHLSLHDILMLPRIWYSLIRAVPNLQWGYFDIFLAYYIGDDDGSVPPKFILPFLSTLSVCINSLYPELEDEPLRDIFANLHLPALRDLSIYIDANPLWHPLVAISINEGLASTPALTKLTLGLQFFGFKPNSIDRPTTEWTGVEKLTVLVPHLTHLALDMCYMPKKPGFGYEKFLPVRAAHWATYLPRSRWLDHANPASAIRKISVVVRDPSKDGPLIEATLRTALELDVEEEGKEPPNIMFEIVSRDNRGLAPHFGTYDTLWG